MCRYFEKEIADRAGYRSIPVFSPGHGFFIVIDGNNEIDMIVHHAVDVLIAWGSKTFRRAELRMRMEITNLLQFIEAGEYRLNFLMIFPVIHDTFVSPVRCLHTECMLNDKPILEPVSEKEAKTLLPVYLGGTQEKINECIFRDINPHQPGIPSNTSAVLR
jgi:hypothetical protein